MEPETFERIVREEWSHLPARFAQRVANLALLIERAPSTEDLHEEDAPNGETLLGLYRGIPTIGRGAGYGGVLPDTITLYRESLLLEAKALLGERRARDFKDAVRLAVRETLWHEIGHHFGLSEEAVDARERAGTNEWAEERALVPASSGPFARLARLLGWG